MNLFAILSGIEKDRQRGDDPDDGPNPNGKRGAFDPGFEGDAEREKGDQRCADDDRDDEGDLHHPAVVHALRSRRLDMLRHVCIFEWMGISLLVTHSISL